MKDGVKDFIAGGFGGAAQCLVGHPFDTVKVVMQTNASGESVSAMGTVRAIVAQHGAAGLYRGVQSPLSGFALLNSALFSAFEAAKRLVAPEARSVNDMRLEQIMFAGAAAGLAGSFIENPVDLLKCQLQVNAAEFNGSMARAGAAVFRVNGPLGLWRMGMTATLARNVPAYMANFTAYEMTKRHLCAWLAIDDVARAPATVQLAAGGAGGFCYWSSIYPLDVVRSRLLADSIDPAKRRYSSMLSAARAIHAETGVRGFFAGVAPCMARSLPANAAVFYVFDLTRRALP